MTLGTFNDNKLTFEVPIVAAADGKRYRRL